MVKTHQFRIIFPAHDLFHNVVRMPSVQKYGHQAIIQLDERPFKSLAPPMTVPQKFG